MRNTLAAAVAAPMIFFSMADTVGAHATWIAERASKYAVVHGEGASNEAYDPAKVGSASAFDTAGAAVAVELERTARNVVLQPAEGAAVLSTVFDEGWWPEDADGEWHNPPAELFPGFRASGKYATYSVAYVAPTTVQNPVGHRLEIVPLADPTALAAGGKLPVRVLWDGAPLQGVSVTNDVLSDWDIGTPLTDADDKTTITVANTGLNVAQVYREVEIAAKPVEGHQAGLSFAAIGPAEE